MPEPGSERKIKEVCIWNPQPRQSLFISAPMDDVGFGGARGGGKSDAVLGDWVCHENTYGQHAIGMAFRRERTQLVELIERAKQIMLPVGYKYHEQDKYFRGPKGGRLRFAYLESDSDADAYQGHSYTRLYPEEMGTFPSEAPINKLQATLRSGHGVPCQMKGTCNPGGPGHQWVKQRYRLGTHPKGFEIFETPFKNPFTNKTVIKTRCFIPSKLQDNSYLGDDYVASLMQVGSPALVKAWLDGDWGIVEGAFFDGWNVHKHVLRPFAVPADWLRFRSMDWGFATPFSIGWWAVCPDDYWHDGSGNPLVPRGSLVRYREWYGCVEGKPNTGLRLTPEEVANGIKDREKDEKIAYGVLDPSAFAHKSGPSEAERMLGRGVAFKRADNTRVSGEKGHLGGWNLMRERLRGDGEYPHIFCFETCRDSVRTIPVLQHDPDKPEDLDTESEDHCFAAGTMVETQRGPVAIEKLEVGRHAIWAAGEWRWNYNPRCTRGKAALVRLTFENGRTITCTPDHKFMDFAGEWRYAKDLRWKDLACDLSLSRERSRSSMVHDITYAERTFSTKARDFIARFGRKITGQSQEGITSTIRITIDPTMHSTIWNAFQPGGTWDRYMAKLQAREGGKVSPWRGLPPANGTAPMPVGYGTASITTFTSDPLWNAKLTRSAAIAARAIKSMWQELSKANIAEITVKPVHCVSVEEAGWAPVYCLSEPVSETFTIEGGFIVSNCADDWRYACMSRPWIPKEPAKKPETELRFTAQADGSIVPNMSVKDWLEMKKRRRERK